MKNKNIEKKFLPQGYRYLKEGEPIKQGDYFCGGDKNNKWNKIRYPEDRSNWAREHIIREEK